MVVLPVDPFLAGNVRAREELEECLDKVSWLVRVGSIGELVNVCGLLGGSRGERGLGHELRRSIGYDSPSVLDYEEPVFCDLADSRVSYVPLVEDRVELGLVPLFLGEDAAGKAGAAYAVASCASADEVDEVAGVFGLC